MRVLLVVPPFGVLARPSLGVHVVQAQARLHRHEVDIFYANISFASFFNEIRYLVVSAWMNEALLAERIMGAPLGADLSNELVAQINEKARQAADERGLTCHALARQDIDRILQEWLTDCSQVFTRKPYDVVGFTTTFQQINGVAVLARKCREYLPNARLVVGGANCDGEMGEAVKDYIPEVDTVFSGETELSFVKYLNDIDKIECRSVIYAGPVEDITQTPQLDMSEYILAIDRYLPDSILRNDDEIKLAFETSRGCWWGQKHHCTFCGLNGTGMSFRQKQPDVVVSELTHLARQTGIHKFHMADNIMPFSYFEELLPVLANHEVKFDLFYEQKANLSLERCILLKRAGVNRIQPGIESLNDDLLRLMKKGTTSRQNLALLRYGRMVEIDITWNLLRSFPGDREEWYGQMLGLLPLICHLQPPEGFYALRIDRFSPYFMNPDHYGITGLRPSGAYQEAFPTCEDHSRLAYRFEGEFQSVKMAKSQVMRELLQAVFDWQSLWEGQRSGAAAPRLEVMETKDGRYLLVDTRQLPDSQPLRIITEEQARAALVFHAEKTEGVSWALSNRVCVSRSGGYVPLACTTPDLLLRFERRTVTEIEIKAAS